MDLIFSRLSPKDDLNGFDCGDDSLNTFLVRYAKQNQQKQHICVTHLARDAQTACIVGFYTLSVGHIPRDDVMGVLSGDRPPYPAIPAMLLARLAIDKRFFGSGTGSRILGNALRKCLLAQEGDAGCRCVIVDAYAHGVDWYRKFGFIPISEPGASTRRMFLDLHTLAAAAVSPGDIAIAIKAAE